jgi:hypothetical protein
VEYFSTGKYEPQVAYPTLSIVKKCQVPGLTLDDEIYRLALTRHGLDIVWQVHLYQPHQQLKKTDGVDTGRGTTSGELGAETPFASQTYEQIRVGPYISAMYRLTGIQIPTRPNRSLQTVEVRQPCAERDRDAVISP